MFRILITCSLVSLSAARIASSQAQPPNPSDTGMKSSSASATENLSVKPDSSLPSRYGIARPPVPVQPIATAHKRSGICRRITRSKCVDSGALIGLVAGILLGSALGPQPEYQSVNNWFGPFPEQKCVANCAPTHLPIYFGIGGSALGALAGWLLSR